MPKTFLVVIAALLVFGSVAAVILRFMPEPVEDSDYLVAGSVATLVALLALFFGLVPKTGDVFVKRRKKQ